MKRVLTGWHFMRVLRVALGSLVVWQGVQMSDWSLVLLGGLFVVTAITNTGCCDANSGAAPGTFSNHISSEDTEDASFEEIKGH